MDKKIIYIFALLIIVIFLLSACNQIAGNKLDKNFVLDNELKDKILKRGNGQRCTDHEQCRSGYCGATDYGDSVCMDDPGRRRA